MDDPNIRIGAANQVALLKLVGEALDDELLGLHLAAEFDPREVGLVYFVLASSGTLAEALARAERYTVITNNGIVCTRSAEMNSAFDIHTSACRVMPTAIRSSFGRWPLSASQHS
jgi:hypothetical protein